MVSRGSRVYLTLVFVFLYLPVVVLIAYSFNDARSVTRWGGFSLRWYHALLQDREIMRALAYTLTIAVLSSVIATVIGTLGAFGIERLRQPLKGISATINRVPVLNPDIVTATGMAVLFSALGIRLGFNSLLLAHISFNIPYAVIAVTPRIRQLPANVVEAALDLGATPAYAFRKVIIPEIFPGIFTALLICFTLSIDDFVISFFTTGSGVSTLAIQIFSMVRRGVNPKINALSTLLFAAVLALLLVAHYQSGEDTE